METETGTIFVVDGDDRIIEVATQEWVENTGDLAPGVISAWSPAETIEIPITAESESTKGSRIIFELPNGCYETPMLAMEPGTTLTIEAGGGTVRLRACERHPRNEAASVLWRRTDLVAATVIDVESEETHDRQGPYDDLVDSE